MTFHFIIIPYVQFHFHASTIYNVCIRKHYTTQKDKVQDKKDKVQDKCKTKRQSARLKRTIDIKTHFYLFAQNQLCTM